MQGWFSFLFEKWLLCHAGDCPGIASNVLRCLQNISGLIWLCKNCEESGKKLLRNGPDDINEIGSKLACIQKQLAEQQQLNENKLENTAQKIIEEQALDIERKLENKINLVIEKQQQIPEQIKTSWQKKQCTASDTKHEENYERNCNSRNNKRYSAIGVCEKHTIAEIISSM